MMEQIVATVTDLSFYSRLLQHYSGRYSSKVKKLTSGITNAWILAVLVHMDHDENRSDGSFYFLC